MITQRALVIGLVGACFYVIALVNELPSYYSILTWLAMTVLISSAGVALLSLQGVNCRWKILRSKATASLATLSRPAEDQGKRRRQPDDEDAHSSAQAETERIMDAEANGPMIQVELENGGTLNKTGVIIEVRLRHLTRPIALTRHFMIESLPAGVSMTSTLTLRGLPRGCYEVVEISAIGSDVLGLFRARRRFFRNQQAEKALRVQQIEKARVAAQSSLRFYVSMVLLGIAAIGIGFIARRFSAFGGVAAHLGGMLSMLVGISGIIARQRGIRLLQSISYSRIDGDFDNQLLVGPATGHIAALPNAQAADSAGQENAHVNSLGRGDELRGTRPYVAGDDLRTVHWKSTARLGRLVVREFHIPARSQSIILWDGSVGAATKDARSVSESESLAIEVEFMLSLVASLCRGWIERGLVCTLLRLDSAPKVIKSGAGGAAPLTPFVDALAVADAGRTSTLVDSIAQHYSALPREGDVFLVTPRDVDKLPEDLARVAALLRQRGARVTVIGISPVPTENGGARSALSRAAARLRHVQNAAVGNTFDFAGRTDASNAHVVGVPRQIFQKRGKQLPDLARQLHGLLRFLLQTATRESNARVSQVGLQNGAGVGGEFHNMPYLNGVSTHEATGNGNGNGAPKLNGTGSHTNPSSSVANVATSSS